MPPWSCYRVITCIPRCKDSGHVGSSDNIKEFGSLADAAIGRALKILNKSTSSPQFKKSIVAKHIPVQTYVRIYMVWCTRRWDKILHR